MTGTMTFPRPDAEELREIKMGRRTLQEVEPMYNAALAECEASVDKSTLPEKPDVDKIRGTYERMVARALLKDERLRAAVL
jgi:hypothetical protein